MSGNAGEQPGWDDRIVPALKKRLESESAYISSRLPTQDSHLSDHTDSPPSSSARQRTKSTPFGNAGPSDRGTASRIPRGPVSGQSGFGYSPSARQPSGSNRTGLPSRIQPPTPIRRPSGGPVPADPEAGPSTRKLNPPAQEALHLLHPDRLPSGAAPRLQNRDSFDLSTQHFPEVSLRNELPPFRMNAEEAMRIAERGHALEDEDEGVFMESDDENLGTRREEWSAEVKRKRSESLSARTADQSRFRWNPDIDGMPSSSRAGEGIGLGTPSSRNATAKRNATNPLARSAPASSTTRSASLNMLASPSSTGSRIGGVAAHLVPPESSFTPPKGANWDEVVLPAVARKMGMGTSPTASHLEDGDLAVEWDRNGTPTKWAKPHPLADSTSSRINQADSSAFSTSFDTSPDNPLQPSPSPTPAPGSHRPMRPYMHAYDGAPSSPAPFTQLDPVPPNLAPPLQHQQSAASFRSRGSQHAEGTSADPGPRRTPSLLRRRPSDVARQRQASNASLRAGQPDQRQQAQFPHGPSSYASHVGHGGGNHASFDNALSGAIRGGEEEWRSRAGQGGYGWEEYPTPPQSGHRVSREGGRPVPPRKSKDGDHGKGCGCVIM